MGCQSHPSQRDWQTEEDLQKCSPETCHQDPGFTYGMGKRPLGRADKVKPSPQQTAPDAGPKLANMEEKWSFKQ